MEAAEQHVDLEVLQELRDVMGDEFSALVQTFARDSQLRIEAIRVAVQQKDPDSIRRTAHSFKGSASNMGAPRLTRLCRALEELGRNGQSDGSASLLTQIEVEYRHVLQALENL